MQTGFLAGVRLKDHPQTFPVQDDLDFAVRVTERLLNVFDVVQNALPRFLAADVDFKDDAVLIIFLFAQG